MRRRLGEPVVNRATRSQRTQTVGFLSAISAAPAKTEMRDESRSRTQIPSEPAEVRHVPRALGHIDAWFVHGSFILRWHIVDLSRIFSCVSSLRNRPCHRQHRSAQSRRQLRPRFEHFPQLGEFLCAPLCVGECQQNEPLSPPRLAGFHSARNAIIGSTRAARRAGSQEATRATMKRSAETKTKLSGSAGLIS